LLIAVKIPTQTNQGFEFVTGMRVNVTSGLKDKGSILEVVHFTRYSPMLKVLNFNKQKIKKKNTLEI